MEQYQSDEILRQVGGLMAVNGIGLWGLANLSGITTPTDDQGRPFPRALSFAVPMNPSIMAGITGGPTDDYAGEYARVNLLINDLSEEVETIIVKARFRAKRLAASVRTDPVNIRGEFPHKTAATKAGLGWIGKNCQLITRKQGPWVRLVWTVFTDLDSPCDRRIEKSGCGHCRQCVEACPAGALVGSTWTPGMTREKILDAGCCDQWKKTHYMQFANGHNCGICAAVCPFGK